MSYAVTLIYGSTKVAAATVTNIAPIPGGNVSYIYVSGATFRSVGKVAPGDGAVITGSGAGNNGTHLIVAVTDDETLIVRATLSTEAGVASVAVNVADHLLDITDETSVNWDTVLAQVNEPALCEKFEVTRDSAIKTNYHVFAHSFMDIHVISTSAITTLWESKEEIVYGRSTNHGVSAWRIYQIVGDLGNVHIRLGENNVAAGRRGYRKGSVWVQAGIVCFGNLVYDSYGSFIIPGTAQHSPGNAGQMFGCLINGGMVVQSQTSTGVEIQDVMIYGPLATTQTVTLLDRIGFADNFINARQTQSSLWGFGTNPVLVQKFAVGDVVSPWVALFNTSAEWRDMQTDTPIQNWVTVFPGSGLGQKTYTYNPVFTDLTGDPLVGATVSIYQIDDAIPGTETPIAGSPFTTDANGQINAGAGEVLEIQRYEATPQLFNYSYRVQVELAGHRLYSHIIKLTQPFESEVKVDYYEAALEGEEATL